MLFKMCVFWVDYIPVTQSLHSRSLRATIALKFDVPNKHKQIFGIVYCSRYQHDNNRSAYFWIYYLEYFKFIMLGDFDYMLFRLQLKNIVNKLIMQFCYSFFHYISYDNSVDKCPLARWKRCLLNRTRLLTDTIP